MARQVSPVIRARRKRPPREVAPKPKKWKVLRWMWRAIIWLIWEFPGFRAIWEHIKPPTEEEKKRKRPAPTFVLWIAGIYTAIFGLASARYENQVDRVELRASSVISLMANDRSRAEACAQIQLVQRREVPIQPVYWLPHSPLLSFMRDEPYQEGADLLKRAVESSRKNLRGADLAWTDLEGVNLRNADLAEARLNCANLTGADLYSAILAGAEFNSMSYDGIILASAILSKANLGRADLTGASLQDAILRHAKLQNANLSGTDLRGADLTNARLNGADLSGSDLHGTSLRGTNLEKVNLTGAIITYADLRRANLSGVDLGDADLSHADLRDANLGGSGFWIIYASEGVRSFFNLKWRQIKSITNANITGVFDPPPGFTEWAIQNGAIDYEWNMKLLHLR